jgi:hypothetical protein
MVGARRPSRRTGKIQQMIIDYNRKLIAKALSNGGRIVPKEVATHEFTEKIIKAVTKFGRERKTEASMVVKLKMQRKLLCRQLNRVQQKIVMRIGPKAKAMFRVDPHVWVGNDYDLSEKARLSDAEIQHIRDIYPPMPYVHGRSFHTDELTDRQPRVERNLERDRSRVRELRHIVAMLKKEIARQSLVMDTVALELDQDPVKLTAVPYWMKPRVKDDRGRYID